jgi:hypothetical protein
MLGLAEGAFAKAVPHTYERKQVRILKMTSHLHYLTKAM